MGASLLCRLDTLFISSALSAVLQVFHDCVGEQKGLLKNLGDLNSKGILLYLINSMFIYFYRSGVNVVVPGKDIDNGTLAGSGGPTETDHLSRFNMKVIVLQYPSARYITEVDVLEIYDSLNRRHWNGIRFINNLWLFIQNFEHSRSSDYCRDYLAVAGEDLRKRT